MSQKRIKTLQPILLAGEQIPRPVGYIAEVSEAEANALITVGYAAETKETVSTDGATQIEGFVNRLPADMKKGAVDTSGRTVAAADDAGDQLRTNVASAQKDAGLSTKAPTATATKTAAKRAK